MCARRGWPRGAGRASTTSIVLGGDLLALVGVVGVELPGVPVARLVDVGPELVAAAVEHLARRRACRTRSPACRPRAISTRTRSFSSVSAARGHRPPAGSPGTITRASSPSIVPAVSGRPSSRARSGRGDEIGVHDEHARARRRRRQRAGESRASAGLATSPRAARSRRRARPRRPRRPRGCCEPGRMSWNSLRSSTRHGGSSDSGQPARRPARPAPRQRLGGDERALGAAVRALGAALRGQRAAVELEVELADPDRQLARAAPRRGRRTRRRARSAGAGQRREVVQLARRARPSPRSAPPPPSP